MGIVTTKQAAESAFDYIRQRKLGLITSVKTPWRNVDRCYMDGLEWGWIITIAGMSGSGKTAFLNLLQNGILDNNPHDNIDILNFNLEMIARRLVARQMSHELKIPVRELYTNLSEEDYRRLKSEVMGNLLERKNIFYVELTSRISSIAKIILGFAKKRNTIRAKRGLVVSLDHSIMVEGDHGETERILLKNLMKMFNKLKKKIPKSMYIILSQMNRDIEKPERKTPINPSAHYPIKGDIFGGDSLYQFSDAVMVIHDPWALKIKYYGPQKIYSKGKIFLHHLKHRDGRPTTSVFKNELHINNLEPYRITSKDKYNAKTTKKSNSGKGRVV